MPTVFVKTEPLACRGDIVDFACRQMAEAYGCTVLESLTVGTLEADIAITNSATIANDIACRTTHTLVFCIYIMDTDEHEDRLRLVRRGMEVVAERFPGRFHLQPADKMRMPFNTLVRELVSQRAG